MSLENVRDSETKGDGTRLGNSSGQKTRSHYRDTRRTLDPRRNVPAITGRPPVFNLAKSPGDATRLKARRALDSRSESRVQRRVGRSRALSNGASEIKRREHAPRTSGENPGDNEQNRFSSSLYSNTAGT